MNARMIIYLFDNISGWAEQTVLSENIQGVSTFLSDIESTADNRWVRVSVGDLMVGESRTVTVTQVLKIKSVDFSINPNNVGTSYPPETLDHISSVAGLFESDDESISALAHQLTDNTENPYYKARQIFDFVMHNLRYSEQTTEHGALWALQTGVGDCTEFSNLFIALARAVGIPAKAVAGYGYNPAKNTTEARLLGHTYSIFYLPNYGWVPADAVWPLHIGSFGEMDYAHIAGATTGGEGVVRGGTIYWPGPGTVKEPYITHSGQRPSVDFTWVGGTITPEILVDASLQTSSPIQNDVLTLTMTVKNLGRSLASNITAELEVDPTYFEIITPPQRKASLASGGQWATTFEVQLKEGAYGNRHTLTSKVTYDSSYGDISGTFLAKGKTPISIPAKPAVPQQVYDIMLFALIGVLVGAIVVAGITLARR
ncbi:MAG: transglutaminase-like domain-containing protein [Candidatus Hodarchaeaceae archaeon]|nr:transglutaminase-like domain-containing protein [Candidatus Hodarchaeaceae archaeon]